MSNYKNGGHCPPRVSAIVDTDRVCPLIRKLAAIRVSEGVSQRELAERVGVAQTTVQQYESGVRKAPLSYVVAAFKVFNRKLILREQEGMIE